MSETLNPGNLLLYLGLFTAVLTGDVNLDFKIFLAVLMAGVVFFWDVFIIALLSKHRVRPQFSKTIGPFGVRVFRQSLPVSSPISAILVNIEETA